VRKEVGNIIYCVVKKKEKEKEQLMFSIKINKK